MEMPKSLTIKFNVSKCAFAKNEGEKTITLNLSKLTPEDWKQYALRSIAIRVQGIVRGKGKTAEEWDWAKEYEVPPCDTRVITTEKAMDEVEKWLAKLPPEVRKAFIAKQMGAAGEASK